MDKDGIEKSPMSGSKIVENNFEKLMESNSHSIIFEIENKKNIREGYSFFFT